MSAGIPSSVSEMRPCSLSSKRSTTLSPLSVGTMDTRTSTILS